MQTRRVEAAAMGDIEIAWNTIIITAVKNERDVMILAQIEARNTYARASIAKCPQKIAAVEQIRFAPSRSLIMEEILAHFTTG